MLFLCVKEIECLQQFILSAGEVAATHGPFSQHRLLKQTCLGNSTSI